MSITPFFVNNITLATLLAKLLFRAMSHTKVFRYFNFRIFTLIKLPRRPGEGRKAIALSGQ